MSTEPDSRAALHELIDLLQEVDRRWAGPEWNLMTAEDAVPAHRALMHILEGGLAGYFETDPARPQFRSIVTAWRKFTGDNADALYFDAPVSPEFEYKVTGQLAGAVYTSFTVEIDSADGSLAKASAGVINDTQFDVDEAGRFEFRIGGTPANRNWIELPPGATRITTRHYYEDVVRPALDPRKDPQLKIEVVAGDPGPAPVVSDAKVSEGIRRVATFIRARTLDMPSMAHGEVPDFVSTVPNQFPKPIVPGGYGLAAIDCHYSMAPFVCGPDQAVVVRGRWPKCRMANVNLWNRHQQTFDYVNRTVSLNRAETTLEDDGSFKMVIAHSDPGLPNWIDTEGRPFGMVFWRYMLSEEDPETPLAEVVPFDEIALH